MSLRLFMYFIVKQKADIGFMGDKAKLYVFVFNFFVANRQLSI